MPYSPSNVIDFLHIVEKLKRTKRTGWINNSIASPESIADHMYRMSIMTLLVDDASLDRAKCTKMALVHDLAESLVGDITPHDGVSKQDKHKMEKDAMSQIVKTLGKGADEIEALWQEYEDCETSEALFVHDIDKCEMVVQALEYEMSDKKDLESFFESTRGRFRHPQVAAWAEEVYERRMKMKK